MTCPNVNAPYCMAHDYDHVLERRESDVLTGFQFGSTRVDRRRLTCHDGIAVAEASDLGFPVGNWPLTIVVDDRSGRPLTFARGEIEKDRDGDVTVVKYEAGALSIHVLND